MDFPQLFAQRYDALTNFWLAGIWDMVPHDLMRQRPHPRVNSIAWILWHMTRVEDAGLSRFAADLPQVLDAGDWMPKIKVPWRHNGSDMTLLEVDELSRRVDLEALHAYAEAVQVRTRAVVSQLTSERLDATLGRDRLQTILVTEGLAHSAPQALLQNYLGWTVAKAVLNFGLTHPYQHLGEIDVIATLLGVDFG